MSAWKLVPVEGETHGISDAYVRGYVWAMDNWPATITEAKKAAADYEDKWINGVIPNTTKQSELASPDPTTDEALVERVARAIWEDQCKLLGKYRKFLHEPDSEGYDWDDLSLSKQNELKRLALAAIRAMEEKP